MSRPKQELRDLKELFSEKTAEKIRAQTRLEDAKKRRDEATDAIKAEGHTVKTLPKAIDEMKTQLDDVLSEIRTQLEDEGEGELDFDE